MHCCAWLSFYNMNWTKQVVQFIENHNSKWKSTLEKIDLTFTEPLAMNREYHKAWVVSIGIWSVLKAVFEYWCFARDS